LNQQLLPVDIGGLFQLKNKSVNPCAMGKKVCLLSILHSRSYCRGLPASKLFKSHEIAAVPQGKN
jgi:hypothetical protein